MRVPRPARSAAAPRPDRPSPRLRASLALVSGAAVALAGVAPAATLTAVGAPAAAAPADGFTSATLAGDLQSELGCAEDWSPACEATALTPNGDGTFTGTFDVPAGTWQVKIAMDGGWDTAFGNDGENLPLVLAAPASLTFTIDPATGEISLGSPDLTAPATGPASAQDAGLIGAAARPANTENFYFVLADRFANGDPANDTGGLEGDRLTTGFDPTSKAFYNGGDLRGVVEQLDYIESLGTTAIWLTPSFTNRPVQGEGADASAGYHGYWVTDFTQIDPHLGGNDALRELVDAAHDRGLKIYLDIITNHTADVIDYEEGRYGYIDSATSPWVATDGTAYDAQALAAVAGGDDFPEFDASGFPYTPVRRDDAPRLVPEWLNDVTKYHNRGDSTWSGESVTYGDFVGLDDLMTEDPEVVDGFTDVYNAWMDFGVDGFRIDTAKHVNMEFWEDWTAGIDAHAADVDPDFFTFGEVYDADARLLAPYSRRTGMDATLDFAFQSAAVAYAKGGSPAALQAFFATDDHYTGPGTSAAMQPTFLGNHDMGRVGFFLAGAGDELARSALAHDLMYLTRGQPVVYYGDEQGMAGTGGDKDARQSMFATQVAEYADQPLLDGTALGRRDLHRPDAPLAARLGALAALRDEHEALATGAQVPLTSSDDGVLALSRVGADDRTEYVVLQNNSTSARTTSVDTLTPGATFTPVYASTGAQASAQGSGTYSSGADGALEAEVPALGSLVLRADREIPAAQSVEGFGAPTLTVAPAPATGAGAGLAAIEADVPGDGYAPVSFAVREVGTEEWTSLGTDDGAAQDGTARVFHDVRDVPAGTVLEYRAVARGAGAGAPAEGETVAASSILAVAGVDLAPAPAAEGELVTIPGSHNSAQGCAGNWAPDCAQAGLALDAASGMYTGTFDIPAGTYEYKVAVGGSWDVSYGAGGAPGGDNLTYTHAGGPITFVYDPISHLVTTTADGPLVTLPGSFNAAVGCAADWAPDCLATVMFDPDRDGVYTWTTQKIPTGSHEVKVAHGRSWAENYGVDGARDGANHTFTTTAGRAVTFSYDLATHRLTIEAADAPLPGTGQFQAHWLAPELLAFPATLPAGAPAGSTYELHTSATGGIALVDGEVRGGGAAVPLSVDPAGLPADARELDPHLAGYTALRLPSELTAAQRDAVEVGHSGQAIVVRRDAQGTPVALTGVQVARLLDALYADAARAGGDLGPQFADGVPTLTLWAPTATTVDLLRWPDAGELGSEPQRVVMERHDDGTWTVRGEAEWKDSAYLFDVTVYSPAVGGVVTNRVTDPYSVGLTLNSTHSVLTDLTDDAWAPQQWASTPAPRTERAVDKSIYELHVRDFSISDESVPADLRGTYGAFALESSNGVDHLRDLAQAGLTSVHLLPTFDIATIEEDRDAQATPQIPPVGAPGTEFGPDGTGQQAAVTAVADEDAFNWGYDPLHYTTPEGSYASTGHQDGGARVAEFRSMVGGLHDMGLEVILDQVFNHTAASGQAERSVLDKVVPGYYHRLSPTGSVETSTCCQNIATEHEMAEQLMVDSVVTWARDYKVDGFRFDLMGHHSKENMLAVRRALDELTVAEDGVDGASIYLYGEGWDFGEVADGARFEQATQGNLGGTGIGTFSDRMRDAVHGGSPVDGSSKFQQGFGTGAYVDPNGRGFFADRDVERADSLHQADLVRLGLAGNLRDFRFLASDGQVRAGDELDYRGDPAGYADEPQEVVSYVDAHDNETLFDLLTLKLPAETSMADTVRMNTLSLATVSLSQTPAFWHAGTDLLRSKSLDRDSYNSGDWFNRIDFSGQTSNFGVGLPPAEKNEDHWDEMRPLLADPANTPAPQDMAAASAAAQDLLKLRYSTPLFRLGSAQLIEEKVSFPGSGPDAQPGVVTMLVDDRVGADIDEALDGVLVVFNATPEPVTQTVEDLAGTKAALSEIQAQGSDDVVKATTWDAASGTVTVPARTVAVLTLGAQDSTPEPPSADVLLANGEHSTPDISFSAPAEGEVVTGDWDGDGVDTLAWRVGNRITFASSNVAGGGTLSGMWYGKPSDEMVVGDWNGDGVDTIGMRRGNVFHLRDDLAGGDATVTYAYGRADDEIVVGDFDGDGKDTPAVRRGNAFHLKDTLTGGPADRVIHYGKPGETVLVGDLDGDGTDSFVVRRGDAFHLRRTLTTGNADVVIPFGEAGDTALLGDWDGDGIDSIGVLRP